MADGSAPRAHERVGTVLNEKWTLEHLIGSGGMGAVYAARHRNGARAAVKVLHLELARMPEVRERFLREGYAANRVEHRGAVQVLDDDIIQGGPDEGSAFLVMELLEGESLQDRALRSPKLTERELLEVTDAVLDVLAAAHEHGVIHRDLKPENIFLARDPERDGVRVKVLDFGLARLTETNGVTNAGMAVGTPSFMSPEQAAGRSAEIDGRTDVFALGATLFRVVTGRRLHDADNMVQLVLLMASTPPPALRAFAPTASEAFANVVDRALAFDRAARPDANALRVLVRAALERIACVDDATLSVIPFSARNIRVGSFADLAQPPSVALRRMNIPGPGSSSAPEDTPRVEAAEARVEQDAKPPSEPPPVERDHARWPRAIGVVRSATLPWLLVFVLLAVGAWKLGPSFQRELVKRGSVWTSAPSATSPVLGPTAEPDDAGVAAPPNVAAGEGEGEGGPDGSARAEASFVWELEAGVPSSDGRADQAEPLTVAVAPSPVHDAGATRAAAPRPHVDRPSPHAVKPSPKKPPPTPRKRKP